MLAVWFEVIGRSELIMFYSYKVDLQLRLTALAILEETICLIEKETKHTKKEKSESLIAFSLD